jgi:glyoxylate reductase
MDPKRVYITRSILSDGARFLREQGLHVDVNEKEGPLSYSELKTLAGNYDALITMLSDQIDREFLEANPKLKIIANYAVGFNNIDVAAARELGIAVTNTPDVLTEATAETALGLMIAAARNFGEASASVSLGEWKSWAPKKHLGHALREKTLGIVGLGRIGGRLAEMASLAFKMNILYTSRTEHKETTVPAKRVELFELLEKSDFVSLHVPLSGTTKNLLGETEFKLMKKSAVLINTARGEIIDQEALIHALKTGQIFSAGLDVTTPEPLPLTSDLHKLNNVFILPHIGSATYEARREMSLLCAKNVLAGLNGWKLLSPV